MKFLLFVFLFSFLVTGCISRKHVVYFQGQESAKSFNHQLRLKKDDFLSINVFGIDENSFKLFNIPQAPANINRGYNNGVPSTQGYLIDENGEIDFPVIGKVKLENLSRTEAIALLESKLKEYLTNPVITIQIQNFKVTVLGEVRNPGTFNIPNEKISLVEAIGLANDLTINGVRQNIKLIREENNVRTEYLINLTDKSILNSQFYYLQQNDIIYVEPNRAKINSSMISSAAGVFISIATLLVTTINSISK